jgi:Cu2+-exporting ATPase
MLRYAEGQGIVAATADAVRNVPGQGVEGSIEGARYRFGRQDFVLGLSASTMHTADSTHTEAWLGDAQGPIARFRLGDALKADARDLIAALERAGKRVHLLSGDGAGAVAEAAAALGISRVCAAATPEDKRAYVRTLQADGGVVAMVGDGINDAPVLAQADVSVAMASGATLAQAQADAVLLSGKPADLRRAIGVATRAMHIIRQNLAWAFGYNFLVIPAAAMGWVSPWLAAVGMSASSLLVIGNALRLRRAREET